VHTNDREAGTLTIGLTVFVEVPIVVRPSYVLLSGVKGTSSTRAVDIIAALDKPLLLEADSFSLEGIMKYRIKEVEKDERFRVHVISDPDAQGTFTGFLNLRTNYPEKPALHIRIKVRIKES